MTTTTELIALYRDAPTGDQADILRGCHAGADIARVRFLSEIAETESPGDALDSESCRIEAIRELGLIAALEGEAPGRLSEAELTDIRRVIPEILGNLAGLDTVLTVRIWAIRALAECDVTEAEMRILAAIALDPGQDALLREGACEALLEQGAQSPIRQRALALLDRDPDFRELIRGSA